MIQRIQLRRTKGWRIPAGVVIVDRRTKWGTRRRTQRRRQVRCTNFAAVGHLRVGLSVAEVAVLADFPAEHDAGESGPERRRTKARRR